MSQIPSVGRMVHYESYGTPRGEHKSECCAAVVAKVADAELGVIGLAVFYDNGLSFKANVKQDEQNHCGGSWHWPEFV